MAAPMFIFGGDTGVKSPRELKRLRDIAEALGGRTKAPQNLGEGLNAIGEALLYRSTEGKAARLEKEGMSGASKTVAEALGLGAPSPVAASPVAAALNGIPDPAAKAEVAATSPSADVSENGSTFEPFINTVKAGGLTNPFGLAAVAATGKAESGWSPANADRSWSDPSESGKAGTAGGVMSWRAERLQGLQQYAASKGEQGNGSPQTQAEFFMREDPSLIAKLNEAKSPEEAAGLMANAWKFAGYDRPGGENSRRTSLAASYLPRFSGGNTEVASLDPSAGMSAAGAIDAAATPSGYVDPSVSAQPAAPAFDAGRFGPNIKLAEMPPTRADIAPQMRAQAAALANPAQQQPQPLPPPQTVGPAPQVAAVPQQSTAPQQPQPAAPVQVAQAVPDNTARIQKLQQALMDPWVSEQQQALLVGEITRLREESDPDTILKRQYLQAQTSKLARDANAPVKRETSVINGNLVDNQTGAKIASYPDEAKPTSDRQNYEYYRDFEKQAGRSPLGPLEWEQAQRKAGANSTTTIVGGEGDKFYENLDKKNAETFAAMSDGGMQARAKLGQIDRLEGLFANVPQGVEGGLKKIAGDWGVAIGDGTSDIQAASALLEKMVPEQRAPGSGPMSDADIKMFRASLPRVLNQPGGNQLIFQTMRGIADYEMKMGEIADQVADRTIKPADGRKMIRELKNPLAEYKIPDGPTPNEGWKEISPGVRIRKVD